MASTLPIPLPPRTPTPPSPGLQEPDMAGLGLEGVSQDSPAKVTFDPNSLSPMSESFRFNYMNSAMVSPADTNPLSPASTNSHYSGMSVDSAGNPRTGSSDEGSGPFNFQTTTLSKSPIAKSVRRTCLRVESALMCNRTLVKDVGTNTCAAACHTRYSKNHLQELPLHCPIPSQYQHSKSAVLACRRNRKQDSGGACATFQSQRTLFGVLMDHLR
jgi:hypothetical protein